MMAGLGRSIRMLTKTMQRNLIQKPILSRGKSGRLHLVNIQAVGPGV